MEIWLPLMSFAFVASITPGPNNLMLSASGVAFGLKRTIPHIAGTLMGFLLLLVLCGSGVGALVVEYPGAALALKLVGSGYLLYLAWVLRGAFAIEAVHAEARPLSFVQAFLFQFVNPKGWIMALTAASVFMPSLGPGALALFCLIFAAISLPCVLLWTGLGVTLRHVLAAPRERGIAAFVLAGLMLATVVMIWL